jgi:hypothetical protein
MRPDPSRGLGYERWSLDPISISVCVLTVVAALIGRILVFSHAVLLVLCIGLLLLAGFLKLLEELIHMIRTIVVVLAVVLALWLLVGH